MTHVGLACVSPAGRGYEHLAQSDNGTIRVSETSPKLARLRLGSETCRWELCFWMPLEAGA